MIILKRMLALLMPVLVLFSVPVQAWPGSSWFSGRVPAPVIEAGKKEAAQVAEKSRFRQYTFGMGKAVVTTGVPLTLRGTEKTLSALGSFGWNYPCTTLLLAGAGLAYANRKKIAQVYEKCKPALMLAGAAVGTAATTAAITKGLQLYNALFDKKGQSSDPVAEDRGLTSIIQLPNVSQGLAQREPREQSSAYREEDYGRAWEEAQAQARAEELRQAAEYNAAWNQSVSNEPVIQREMVLQPMTRQETEEALKFAKIFKSNAQQGSAESVLGQPSHVQEVPGLQETNWIYNKIFDSCSDSALSVEEVAQFENAYTSSSKDVESDVAEFNNEPDNGNDFGGGIAPALSENPWMRRLQVIGNHIFAQNPRIASVTSVGDERPAHELELSRDINAFTQHCG